MQHEKRKKVQIKIGDYYPGQEDILDKFPNSEITHEDLTIAFLNLQKKVYKLEQILKKYLYYR